MTNGERLTLVGIFTALFAAAAAIVCELAVRYGWWIAFVSAVGALWAIFMCALVANDMLDFCLNARNERKKKR